MSFAQFSDAIRFVEVVVATLLIFAPLRLAWLRIRRGPTFRAPTPESSVGAALLLGISVVRRLQRIGEPGDAFLWFFTLALILLAAGMLRTYRPGRPWHRRDTSGRLGGDSTA